MGKLLISEAHYDALKEVGNIGSGHAATSLSQMLNCLVKLTIPDVEVVDFEHLDEHLGKNEDSAGIVINVVEDLHGSMTTVFHRNLINELLKPFIGKEYDTIEDMDEMAQSALKEIGNITTASYVNALAQLTKLVIDIRPPEFFHDDAPALIKSQAESINAGHQVLVIDEHFIINDIEFQSNMILTLQMESFEKLMETLGL